MPKYLSDKKIEKEFIDRCREWNLAISPNISWEELSINFILFQRHQDREAIKEWTTNARQELSVIKWRGNYELNVMKASYNQALTDSLSFLDGLEGE